MQQWQNFIRPGAAAVSLSRPDNAPHHCGLAGILISKVQSFDPLIDHTATHIAMVRGIRDTVPNPGDTPVEIIDILDGQSVAIRALERNYATEIYNVIKGVVLQEHPHVMSEDLGRKAVEVAEQLIGIPYARTKLIWPLLLRAYRQNIPVDEAYTKELCARFPIDIKNKRFFSDNENESFICSELFIISYQIAWLLLAGQSAANKALPEWVNVRAGVSTGSLTKFLRESPFFEPVPAEIMHLVRYSGTPHPNDPPVPAKHEPLGYSTVRFSVEKYLPKFSADEIPEISMPKSKL